MITLNDYPNYLPSISTQERLQLIICSLFVDRRPLVCDSESYSKELSSSFLHIRSLKWQITNLETGRCKVNEATAVFIWTLLKTKICMEKHRVRVRVNRFHCFVTRSGKWGLIVNTWIHNTFNFEVPFKTKNRLIYIKIITLEI